MGERPWGADVPFDPNEARNRILDAAESCFSRFGLSKTTVDDIAQQAKVSRATVYRYFEGRDEVVLGVLNRELSRFADEMVDRLALIPDLPSIMVESIVLTIAAVRSNPRLAMLFAPHAAGITGEIAGASESLFKMNLDFARPYLERALAAGELRPDLNIEDAAEWVLRVTLSLLTVKGPVVRSEQETRDFLRMFLAPILNAHPA